MKLVGNMVKLILGICFLSMITLYLIQEKLLFYPTKLPKEYQYKFNREFEEIDLKVEDRIEINTVLFKSNEPRGVILFFHGNGGSIDGWGQGADLYLENNYDIMYVDYRGYGKSDGKILSEKQLIKDSQIVYDYLKGIYKEEKIIVSGTSIGSGIAAQIAINNKPKKLILNSPYTSLESLIKEKVKVVPRFVMKYKLRTDEYIKEANLPIIMFHGDKDNLIPPDHSLRLKKLNPKIELHILKGYGHNNITESPKLIAEMNEILD